VVSCHLYTKIEGTSSEGRAEEYKELVSWFKALADEEEQDAVVVGDFNRFLNGKGAWKHLMTNNHEDYFRFPLLEAIKGEISTFDPKKDEAPADRFSTTTAKKASIYDQILIAAGTYPQFTGTPKFGEDIGIVVFDDDPHYEWFINSWHNATKMLSDHRPVWIRLRLDGEDDD
jgi:endonuclease/exonuclease/phosphatase family metal-dependent hydrolase